VVSQGSPSDCRRECRRFSKRDFNPWLLMALLIASIPCAQCVTPSLSPDGSFALNAPAPLPKTHFSRTLSEFESQFYDLTGYAPSNILPIVVVLHDAQTDELSRPVLTMDAMEGNLPRIQVDLIEEKTLSAESCRLLASAMLLREYYYGKAPAPGSRIATFPSWLLHGLGRLCDPDARPGLIPSAYLRGATPPSVEDLLIQKPPEDSHRTLLEIYDAMSAALLKAGLQGNAGSDAFRDWIGRFDPQTPGQTPSSWPSRWEMRSVERRWLLLMAGMSGEQSNGTELLGVDETISRYDEILSEVSTPKHSLALLKKMKGADFLIRQLSGRLGALRLEGNPLSLPLLDQTIQLCSKIRHLSVRKIADQEKSLSAQREAILARSRAINSYLDWYEAARLPVRSGLFDTLLNAPESSVSKGPIGRTLDAVEERGW
jgi:hypothetical protein